MGLTRALSLPGSLRTFDKRHVQGAWRSEGRRRHIALQLLLLNLVIPQLTGALEISNSLLLEVEKLRPREGKPQFGFEPRPGSKAAAFVPENTQWET